MAFYFFVYLKKINSCYNSIPSLFLIMLYRLYYLASALKVPLAKILSHYILCILSKIIQSIRINIIYTHRKIPRVSIIYFVIIIFIYSLLVSIFDEPVPIFNFRNNCSFNLNITYMTFYKIIFFELFKRFFFCIIFF